MRLLHTADWHLGRVLHGASLLEDQAWLLDRLAEVVREERVDAVVVAGDVFDRSVPAAAAVELLDSVLCRLVLDLRCRVVAIAGNHDSPERLSFGSRLVAGAGLHLAGEVRGVPAPVVVADAHGPVYVYPVPFSEPAVVRARLDCPDAEGTEAAMQAILDRVRAAHPAGVRSVVVAHGFVTGGAESESERPLSLGGSASIDASVFDGFDYVALGHLHRPQAAGRTARYAGSLMRYSFSEADHDKVLLLVDVGPDGACEVRSVPMEPPRRVRTMSGTLAQVIETGRREGDRERNDWLSVTLLDESPVFDAIGRIREVFPNVLHVDRPAAAAAGGGAARPDHRRTGDADLFGAFWEDVCGTPLSDEQRAAFVRVAGRLSAGEVAG